MASHLDNRYFLFYNIFQVCAQCFNSVEQKGLLMLKATSRWYTRAFGEFYPIVYPHRNDTHADLEIHQLIKALHLSGDERVLDVCCGAGRHLSALLTRGFKAWGTDLSRLLLKEASNRPEMASRIINADMCWLPFKNYFHVVLNLFTSFGYFLDDNQNKAALKEMVSMLQPDGLLVLDHINRFNLQRNLVKKSSEQRGEWGVSQERRIEGNRVIKEITITSKDGSTTCLTENVKLFYPHEIRELFETAGLKDIRLFGSFEGEPFNENSERMIVIGRKQ